MDSNPGYLFCFGLGYTASALVLRLRSKGWRVAGTCRTWPGHRRPELQGVEYWIFPGLEFLDRLPEILEPVTHVLISMPPDSSGDPVFSYLQNVACRLGKLCWLAYLSTTGVYGDHAGRWVDEETAPQPRTSRQQCRLRAEQSWLGLEIDRQVRICVFRLAGIYGPSRSAIDRVRAGQTQRIDKPGHVFNRIHITDIVNALQASMQGVRSNSTPTALPNRRIYNLTDDHPAPGHMITSYACQLLGVDPLPVVAFNQAEIPGMLGEFFADNRRVSNRRIKQELGLKLEYPSYHSGLLACL